MVVLGDMSERDLRATLAMDEREIGRLAQEADTRRQVQILDPEPYTFHPEA